VTPVEVFRMLVRARRPGPLADEIDSYDRLHWKADGSDRDPDDRDAAVWAAQQVQEWMKSLVAVPLLGRLERSGDRASIHLGKFAIAVPLSRRQKPSGDRAPIDFGYRRIGEPHIFDGTVKVYGKDEHGLYEAHYYVDCAFDDERGLISAAIAGVAPATKERTKSDRKRAEVAIQKVCPKGVPPQSELKNKQLIREVLKVINGPPVSDTTILRAAGRRVDKR
jgi:hypothetical protein